MAVDKWFLDEALLGLDFQMFGSQEEVFEYVDKINEERYDTDVPLVHAFAKEFNLDRRRYFVASEVRTFYKKYQHLNKTAKSFYEIIRGGHPCRLYFDLEYDKRINPKRNDKKTMTVFRSSLMRYIKVHLGIDLQAPNMCDDW